MSRPGRLTPAPLVTVRSEGESGVNQGGRFSALRATLATRPTEDKRQAVAPSEVARAG